MGNVGLISLAACRGPRIWFVCACRGRGRVQRLRRNGYHLWTVRHTAIRGGGGEEWQKRRVYRMRESKRRVLVIRTDCQILLRIFKYWPVQYFTFMYGEMLLVKVTYNSLHCAQDIHFIGSFTPWNLNPRLRICKYYARFSSSCIGM